MSRTKKNHQVGNVQPTITYRPAVLKKTSAGWLIEYYSLNPQTKELQRKQVKMNREAKRFQRVSDFRNYANDVIMRLNAQLAGGWSPYMESDNIRLYTRLQDVMQLYLQEKEKELRPATMVCYKSYCQMLSKWLGDGVGMYASMFGKGHAVRYMDYVYNVRQVSARTWNNNLKMGRALFSWAKEKMYVKENPFEFIKTKRVDKKKRVLIEQDVRQRIKDYLQERNPDFLAVCELVFVSLIRPKEIMMIKVGDVMLAEKCIRIRAEVAKNGNERFSAINGQILDWLLSVHLDKYPDDFYLFGSDLRPSKKRCYNSKFRKEWNKLRNALGLKKEMQLYSFRDSGINGMLKNGIDPLSVMQHADHHDLSMTTRYANHADKHLSEKVFKQAPDF